MNKNDIPVKTSVGLAEMKSRSLGLAPRMRTALLLVDGLKPIGELERLMAAAGVQAGTLEVLFEKGLITIPVQQINGTPASAAAAAPEPPSIPEAKSAREPAAEYEIRPAPELPPASEVLPAAETAAARATSGREAAPDSGPEAGTRAKDAPPVRQHAKHPPIAPIEAHSIPAAGAMQAVHPAPAAKVAASGADLKLVSARAHLASALDEHVGFQSYVLKQRVVNCGSREELESLFGAVEKALGAVLNTARAQAVIGTAKIVLSA